MWKGNEYYILRVSVSLVNLHAKHKRPIILSPVSCPALPYFSTLSNKRRDYREKDIGHKMCAVIVFTALVRKFLILRIIQQDNIINVHMSVCLSVCL